MILVNLSFIPVFIFWAGIIFYFNIQGFIKAKSIWNGVNLPISLILLIIHLNIGNAMPNWSFNLICDLTFLAISISLFLYINDIETRRKVISEVFENRYKKVDKEKDS